MNKTKTAREILFRGIPVGEKEFVYGYYFVDHVISKEFPYEEVEEHYIQTRIRAGKDDCVEAIPETVGQFTGRKDRNEKMIFEKDLVEFKDPSIHYDYDKNEYLLGRIEFVEEVASFRIVTDLEEEFVIHLDVDLAVIGTKHTTSELITNKL